MRIAMRIKLTSATSLAGSVDVGRDRLVEVVVLITFAWVHFKFRLQGRAAVIVLVDDRRWRSCFLG